MVQLLLMTQIAICLAQGMPRKFLPFDVYRSSYCLTSEACGGPNLLSVYSSTPNISVFPVPTAATTDLPEGWTYDGCFRYLASSSSFSAQVL